MKNVVKKYLILVISMLAGTFLAFSFCNAENSSVKEGSIYYTCPMTEHADVVMDKPGKCPKCGMNLVQKKSATIKYVCPMKEDADVVMNKLGKCPKCGMKLVPKEEEGNESIKNF